MGLLSNRGPPPWHPATQEIRNACKQAAEYCQVWLVFKLRYGRACIEQQASRIACKVLKKQLKACLPVYVSSQTYKIHEESTWTFL